MISCSLLAELQDLSMNVWDMLKVNRHDKMAAYTYSWVIHLSSSLKRDRVQNLPVNKWAYLLLSQSFPASTDSVCKHRVHLMMLFFIEPQYLQKSTLQILMPQWTLDYRKVPLHEHVCERHWLTDVTADTSFTNIYKIRLVQPLVKGCRMLQVYLSWPGPPV